MPDILTLAPRSLANTTTVNEGHVLIEVLRNHNPTSMTRTRAHLSMQSFNVSLDVRILIQEPFQSRAVFHHLFKGGGINSRLNAVSLLRGSGCLANHGSGNFVNFHERDVVKLRNVFDETAKLQCVPVRDGHDCIVSPLLNQSLLQLHRLSYIVIDVRVVSCVCSEEPCELKSVLQRINLCNAKHIRHQRTSG